MFGQAASAMVTTDVLAPSRAGVKLVDGSGLTPHLRWGVGFAHAAAYGPVGARS